VTPASNTTHRGSEPLIELTNVSLQFQEKSSKDLEVFKQINLQIFPMDSVVIVGPSGHGKSSLLRLLAGLVPPSEGEVKWGGRPVPSLSRDERLQWLRQIGMLFQRNALFDSMTVFDNVAFPLSETAQLTGKEIHERVEFYLNAVRLLDSSHLFPNQISGGMQKRLGIARALALEPRVVLYDDPTAGLDPITSRQIVQLIQELKQKSKSTIVTVTNDLNRAYQLAGRIAFVMSSQLIETGSKQQTLSFNDTRVQQFLRGQV